LSMPWRVAALGIFFTLTAYTLFDYYTRLDKAPWRETVEFVREQASPGDMVVLNASYTKDVFNYYFQPNDDVTVVAPWTMDEIPASLDLVKRIWLIRAYNAVPTDVSRELMTRIAENRTANKPMRMQGWAEPNPWAFWTADIHVTSFTMKVNAIN